MIGNGKYASPICCESSHKMGDIVDPIVHEVEVRSIKSYPQSEMTFISSRTNALWKLCNVPHWFQLGFKLLCTSMDDEMMKNLSWFCENQVPFEEKYWMTLHVT